MRRYRTRYSKSRSSKPRYSKTKKRKRTPKGKGGSSNYSLSMFNIHPPVAYGNKFNVQPEPYFQSK